ncbi:MAG: hypothetical protein PHS02_01120 [Candidatus ainarchaeum sp.]|nr:hypothetical protein [Candidatus ainarchaeum sp.]
MEVPFKEKNAEQKEPEAVRLKKLDLLDDFENVEIKKLEAGDRKEVHRIMMKTLWEASEQQVADVIKAGFSYGAYVERMLVGAGLAWQTHFDEERGAMDSGEPNALYMEDVALLLAYEGKGIRKMLIDEREKAAGAAGFHYAIALISPDWKGGALEEMIRERGNKTEKEYLGMGYSFARGKDGIFAIKKLV